MMNLKTYKRKRQEHQEIEDVQELCRLCLDRTREGIAIFKSDQDVCAAVAMRIMICVGLEMKYENSLPNMICQNCYEELEKYYKFRRKCEISYQKLKSHLLALQYKEFKDIKIELPKEVTQLEDSDILMDKPIVNNFEETTHVPVEANEQEPSQQDTTEKPTENVTEKVTEMQEEVQIPMETEANTDIGTFLSTILTELGILRRHNDGLVMQDQSITSFELETGDEDQLMVELIEEDDVEPSLIQTVNSEEPVQENVVHEKGLGKKFIGDTRSKQTTKDGKKLPGPWCHICGAAFSSRSAAARHARGHSGARPHACRTCHRTFAQKAVRDRHMLVHLAVRPHACAVCSKSFTQRGALAAHSRTHAAAPARALAIHRCTLCDKVFLYASGLSRHMMSHAGRTFACSACSKQFRDRSSLLRHLRTVYHAPAAGAHAAPGPRPG